MPEQILHAHEVSGSETVKRLILACQGLFETGLATLRVSLVAGNHKTLLENVDVSSESVEEQFKESLRFYSKAGFLDVLRASIVFHPLNNNGPAIHLQPSDGIHRNFQILNIERIKVESLNVLHSAFCFSNKNQLLLDSLPEFQKDLVNAQEQSIAALANQTAHLGEFLAQNIEKNQLFLTQFTEENVANEKKRNEEHEKFVGEKKEELAKERLEFESEKAKFDERESKLVRRDLVDKMLEKIEEVKKFSVEETTEAKRLPIKISAISLMVVGISFISFSIFFLVLFVQSKEMAFPYFAVGMLISGTLMFASTAVYWIKWNSRWFYRHADSEFTAAQTKVDLLRASWIAELIFEAKESGGGVEIPDSLLEGLARNLFENKESLATDHPIDDLQKYAKKFKRFSIGVNGIEVEAKES